MTPRQFIEAGQGETIKGAAHATLGVLAGACCLYNVAALLVRRERGLGVRHLAVNAVVYLGVAMYEAHKARHHWS